MIKSQITMTNDQSNPNYLNPNYYIVLGIGAWGLIGHWGLVIGASLAIDFSF